MESVDITGVDSSSITTDQSIDEIVYEYDNPHHFLSEVLRRIQARHPKYSLRSWAKKLGFRDPTLLSRLLNGKRSLTPRLAEQISSRIFLQRTAARYFELIAAARHAKSRTQKDLAHLKARELSVLRNAQSITADQFEAISGWHHLAILNMLALKGFKSDPQWIAEHLENRCSVAEVKEAWERLQRLGLITQAPQGHWKAPSQSIWFGGTKPSAAIRDYHRQNLERAQESIEKQAFEDRQFLASTLTVRADDAPKVRELLEQVQRALNVYGTNTPETGDQTIQIVLGSFLVAKSPLAGLERASA